MAKRWKHPQRNIALAILDTNISSTAVPIFTRIMILGAKIHKDNIFVLQGPNLSWKKAYYLPHQGPIYHPYRFHPFCFAAIPFVNKPPPLPNVWIPRSHPLPKKLRRTQLICFLFFIIILIFLNQPNTAHFPAHFFYKQICKELELVRSEKGSMRTFVIHNCYKWVCAPQSLVGDFAAAICELPFLQKSWGLLTGIFVKEAAAPSA